MIFKEDISSKETIEKAINVRKESMSELIKVLSTLNRDEYRENMQTIKEHSEDVFRLELFLNIINSQTIKEQQCT